MRMITSVSILPRMIGAAVAVSLLNGFGISAPHRSNVGDRTGNGGCRRARRTREMRSRPRPLAADKVAVGGRHRTLPRRDRLAIGGKAHRATGLAPFEACLDEHLVEPFGDRI